MKNITEVLQHMLLLLVTIYMVTHIALQTNKNNVAFSLSQRWLMGFWLWIWPAALDTTSNFPQIYSFCFKPHPERGFFFFLNGKAFVPFAVSPSRIAQRSLPCYSDLPTSVVFFSPIILLSCLLSPGLEMKTSSHTAKFMLPLPILESKGFWFLGQFSFYFLSLA